MEVSTEIPGMEKLVTTNWNALKMDKGHLSRWIRRLIEGNTKPSELHGVKSWMGEHSKGMKDLVGFLTYGPNSEKYHFKHWGNTHTPPTISLLGRNRLEMYTQGWEGGETIHGNWEMLTKFDVGNTNVQELYGKIMKKSKKAEDASRLIQEPQVDTLSGRVRVSLRLRGNKLKSRLKELNDCKNLAEIKGKLRRMNIWKVTFKEDRSEDKTPGKGWCGYLAIDQVRRASSSAKKIETQGEANMIKKTVDELYSIRTGGGGGEIT